MASPEKIEPQSNRPDKHQELSNKKEQVSTTRKEQKELLMKIEEGKKIEEQNRRPILLEALKVSDIDQNLIGNFEKMISFLFYTDFNTLLLEQKLTPEQAKDVEELIASTDKVRKDYRVLLSNNTVPQQKEAWKEWAIKTLTYTVQWERCLGMIYGEKKNDMPFYTVASNTLQELIEEAGEAGVERLDRIIKLGPLQDIGLQKFDISHRIAIFEKYRTTFEFRWNTEIAPSLEAKGITGDALKKKKANYERFLKTTKIGQDILQRVTSTIASPTNLLIMGFSLHDAPDRDRAAVQYLTFLMAGEAIQLGVQGLEKIMQLALRLLPQESKMLRALSLLGKKGKVGMIAAIALTMVVLLNPTVAKKLTDLADDISDKYLDTDNFAVGTVSNILKLLDIPFGMAGDILNYIGLNLPNPRTDQMNMMKKNVQNYFDPILRGGEILKVGYGTVDNWNAMVNQKISKSSNAKEKELFTLYRIDDIHEWGQRQMLEFHMRYLSLQNSQALFEEVLRQKGVLKPDESLPYVQLATSEQDTYSLRENALPNAHESNAFEIQWQEDGADNYIQGTNNPVMKKVKEYCLGAGGEDVKKQWRELKSSAYELGREVDVYNHLGIYDQKVWCDPYNSGKVGMDAIVASMLWREKRDTIIQLSPGSESELMKQTHEIEQLIPIDVFDTEGFFAWVMSDSKENADLARMRAGIGGILKEFIQLGKTHEEINLLIEKHITQLAIHQGRISYDALTKGRLALVKAYLALPEAKNRTIPKCVRDFIPKSPDYTPNRKPPYDTASESELKIWYMSQVDKLKSPEVTNWTQLNIIPKDGKEIEVVRSDFSDDSIILKRTGILWKMSSKNHGELPGVYDFHKGVALAGLSLYYMKFLYDEVRKPGGRDWKSEDGTKEPFSYKPGDKNGIIYAKDDSLDQEILKEKNGSGNMLDFYFWKINARPEEMVTLLNEYFGKIGGNLGLIGD